MTVASRPSSALPVIAAAGLAGTAVVGLFLVGSPLPFAAALVVTVAYLGFAAISIVLALIDAATHRLPDAIVLPSGLAGILLFGVACLCGADGRALVRALAAMAALFCFYLVLRIVSPAGMGGGDVKLSGVVGLALGWLGWEVLAIGVLSAFLLGGAAAVVLLLSRRADRRTRIPFGPFMLLGAWAGVLLGEAFGLAYGL